MNIGIVGGSLAGCSAAILLSRAGHDVTVFERTQGRLVGRGGGIGTSGTVFDELIERDMIDADFPAVVSTNVPLTKRRSESDRVGHSPWAIPMDFRAFHWSALWEDLRKRVPDHAYRGGERVEALVRNGPDGARIRTADGAEHDFDLVIFADGYRSLGRAALFPESSIDYRGYMLWRGTMREADMDDDFSIGATMPRLSYANMPGDLVLYRIPDAAGSTAPEDVLINWAAYIPLPEAELETFMVDVDGVPRQGTVPPGKMRPEEEARLKRLMADQVPTYFAEVASRLQDTYVQLIYTVDLDAYARDRACVIGDAGIVAQPFTGSGVFKGMNNISALLAALEQQSDLNAALASWSREQTLVGKRLLALGEQLERALIWDRLDLLTADAESTATWWRNAVTFPEDFSWEER